MKKVKLTKEEYQSLRSQLSSSDKEAHVLALKTIEHCDIKESLVFVLLLYKEFNEKVEGGFKSAKGIVKTLESLDIKVEDKLSIDKLWKFIKKYPKEERAVAISFFSSLLKPKIESWGFKIMKDLEMTLTEK